MSTNGPTSSSPLDKLRNQLDSDARLLQALTPGSEAHERLSRRIEQQTRELLDHIDEKDAADRRYREIMRDEYAKREARKLSPEAETRLGGGVAIIIGAGVAYLGWGTWWLALAALLIVVGLLGALSSSLE